MSEKEINNKQSINVNNTSVQAGIPTNPNSLTSSSCVSTTALGSYSSSISVKSVFSSANACANNPTSDEFNKIKEFIKSQNFDENIYDLNDNIVIYILYYSYEEKLDDKLRDYMHSLYLEIIEIRKSLFYNDTNISQYTNINNVHKMFHKNKEKQKNEDEKKDELQENCKLTFRMYNSIYMNDPQEGNIFKKILKKDDDLTKFIEELYPKSKFKPSNVYLTSFSKNIGEPLPMWTNYGNKTNGCKIEIESNYFDGINYSNIDTDEIDKVKSINGLIINTFTLCNVVYYKKDENNNYILSGNKSQEDLNNVEKYVNEIKKILSNISKELNNTTNEQKDFVIITTRDLLAQIRFLFKDDIWAYEEEVRVVAFQDSKEKIKLADVDQTSKVPKLFIELEKEIPYNEVTVTLGSNVGKPNEVAQYLYHVGVKDVKMSEIEYN